jgi:outer membrane protein
MHACRIRLSLTLWVVFFLLPLAQARVPGQINLEEAFQKALKQSEVLAIREEAIQQAKSHRTQAWGTVLPRLNFQATELLQDTATSSGTDGTGSVSNTLTRRSRPEVNLSARQTLFQGLREFQALKVSNAETRQNIFLRDRAKQTLFFEVVYAYYAVLQLEEELSIFNSIHHAVQERTGDLRRRLDLGKSRESEILTTQSQLASVEADRETVHGLLLEARENLAFLIGEPVSGKLTDTYPIPGEIGPVEAYIGPLPERPDLKASAEAVRLAKGRVNYEQGGRLPTVDVEGRYYPYRIGYLSDIDWDVTFALNWPFFQGGAVHGKIQEAKSIQRQTQLQNREDRRKAETEVRQAYDAFKSQRLKESAFRQAALRSGQSHRNLGEEYHLGLINNLEYLQSLRDWLETRLKASEAKYQTKLSYLELLVASGRLDLK